MNRNVVSQAAVGDRNRAFRGLAAVFVLSFVNLMGVALTVTALGGLGEWSRWQFVGIFGLLEAAAGLSNIISPNIWRLPVAEMETSHRTPVKLAASTMLIPHWAGGARAAAGVTLMAATGVAEGFGIASLGLILATLALAVVFVALAAIVARIGVAHSNVDVLQLVIRWRSKENVLPPISLTASVQQFLQGVLTLPAIKLLAPGVLFGAYFRPSTELLVVVVLFTLASIAAMVAAWTGRVDWRAPREQQREAELNA
jgi:hypothetical protein